MIMKTTLLSKKMFVLLMTVLISVSLYAQEEEKKSPFSLGADVVSSGEAVAERAFPEKTD